MSNGKHIPHSFPYITAGTIKKVTDVLKSGHLEDGDLVVLFENKVKKYLGKKYAVATSSGFSAIHLALIGMGVKKGDDVIIPSYSCGALLNPVLIQGANPIVVDIAPNSFNISYDAVKKKITRNTKAIIVPHIFGYSAPVEKISSLGIPVIEDCAQSFGGTYNNKRHGSLSGTSILSFYATKMMTTGDGGMLLTNEKGIYETALNHRYYGHKKQHRYAAYNYKMNNIEAAMGMEQMEMLGSFSEKRKKIAAIYDSFFFKEKNIHIKFENRDQSIFYRYPIYVQNKERIKKALADTGIGCGYGVLEGMHELVDANVNDFPNTVDKLNNILSIPIYPKLSLQDARYIAGHVVDTVNKFTQKKSDR